MRIVAWNCRRGFDAKAAALIKLAPDIAVVPESPQVPAIALESLFDKPVPHLWTGTNTDMGLGIFAPGATELARLKPDKEGPGQYGLAARIMHGKEESTVVGIWSHPLAGPGNPYLAALVDMVDRYGPSLATGRSILAGDFNVSGRTCKNELTDFIRILHEKFGLVSAYHSFHGVAMGAEKTGTLWWMHDRKQEYHCDFVFVPAAWSITRVEVGAYEEWGAPGVAARSDHAPVIVDVSR